MPEDAVQRSIGGYGDGADFGGEYIVPREEVRCGVKPFTSSRERAVPEEVVAAHLYGLGVVCADSLSFQDGGGDADNFCLAIGLPCDDGQGNKGGDGCQQEAQQAKDKAVVQFHGYIHSCSVFGWVMFWPVWRFFGGWRLCSGNGVCFPPVCCAVIGLRPWWL